MLAALRAVRMCSDQSSLLAASIGGATAHIYPCAQVHVRVLYVLPGLGWLCVPMVCACVCA